MKLLLAVLLTCVWIPASSKHAPPPAGEVTCGQAPMDPYRTWSGVIDARAAEDFVSRIYSDLETPEDLAEWLACQGFEVEFLPLHRRMLLLQASFAVAAKNRPPLWGEFKQRPFRQIWTHNFQVKFDDRNRIINVSISNTQP
jgi:hypothetical protein